MLGREFPERLLQAIADTPERLDADLQDLHPTWSSSTERSDAEERVWVFKHALTQDVAHTTLVTPRRRALHRRAADALAALYPDRLADLAPGSPTTISRPKRGARPPRTRAGRRCWRAGHGQTRRPWRATTRRCRPRSGPACHPSNGARCCRPGPRCTRSLGHFEPARADLEAALALADGACAVGQGRVLTALGALWGGHRDYARGLDLTRQAVDLLAPAGDASRARGCPGAARGDAAESRAE